MLLVLSLWFALMSIMFSAAMAIYCARAWHRAAAAEGARDEALERICTLETAMQTAQVLLHERSEQLAALQIAIRLGDIHHRRDVEFTPVSPMRDYPSLRRPSVQPEA
jgi:hypothetical protein